MAIAAPGAPNDQLRGGEVSPISKLQAPHSQLWPLLFLLFPLFVFVLGPALMGETFLHEDIVYYFFGLRRRLALGLSEWNPWISSGLPFIGDGQSAPFYPLNLPYYLLPTSLALPLSTGLNLLVGSALMWFWLASKGLGPWARSFGALVFVWSGFFWLHLHHLTFLSAGVWLPGLFWGADVILNPTRRTSLGVAGVAGTVAMMLLGGGSPQLLLYGVYALFAYAFLGGAASNRYQAIRSGLRALLPVGLAVALGALAGAVALLPFALAASERFVDTLVGYQRSTTFALPFSALLRLLIPDAIGNPFYGAYGGEAYWEEGATLGLLTLGLIPVALRGEGRGRWFFAGLCLVSLLGMLGTIGILHPLFYAVLPGYSLFRAPGRLYLLLSLGGGVLGAYGLQGLSPGGTQGEGAEAQEFERSGLRRRLLRFLLPAVVVATGLGFFLGGGVPALRGGAVAVVILLAAAWALRAPRVSLEGRPFGLPGVLTFLLMVELSASALTFNHTVPRAFAEEPTHTDEALHKLHLQEPLLRVMVDDSAPPRYLNGGMEAGYLGLRGYNPLNSQGLISMMAIADGLPPGPHPGGIVAQVETPTSPVFDLMAAGFYLSEAPPSELPGDFKLISQDPSSDLRIYQNPRALKRVFLPGEVRVEEDATLRGDAIREAASLRPPPLILAAAPEGADAQALGPSRGEILAVRETPDRLEIDLDMEGPGYVVVGDIFAPGWEARVDDIPQPILRVYEGLRAVALESAGEHRVTMVYETPGLRLGAVGSALGWAGIFLLLFTGLFGAANLNNEV